jgi:hypothetical protein
MDWAPAGFARWGAQREARSVLNKGCPKMRSIFGKSGAEAERSGAQDVRRKRPEK